MISSGEEIFITQSKCINITTSGDEILSDVLDMEEGKKSPNFKLKCGLYSDISDEDAMIKATQEAEEIEGRFRNPMQKNDVEELLKSGLSNNTETKSRWAVSLFSKWQQHRRNCNPNGAEYACDIMQMTNTKLNEALGFFITEVRMKNGDEYRPNTLYELIIAIQHYMRRCGRFVNFLDDNEFNRMRSILDAKMKDLSKKGFGIERNRADVISQVQENELYERRILGTDTPQKLLDTLVYQLGLHFALRAGQEHRNLRVGEKSQIQLKTDSGNKMYVEYREDVSKSNTGGIKHRKIEPKVTRAYENVNCPERCPVKVYEKYMSLRPNGGKCDALYLRPRKYVIDTCWFADAPVGVHQLQLTVKRLCNMAGFQGNYTNHSLRATAATRLYNAGIDEQLISEKTGHRSSAVRSYKRTTDQQLHEVSDILHGEPSKKTKTCVKNDVVVNNAGAGQKEVCISTKDISINIKF